jgi:hypothetical protein
MSLTISSIRFIHDDHRNRYWEVDVRGLTAAQVPKLIEILDAQMAELVEAEEEWSDPQWSAGFFAGVKASHPELWPPFPMKATT